MSTLFFLAQATGTTQPAAVIEPIAPVSQAQPGTTGTSTLSTGTPTTQDTSKSLFDGPFMYLAIGMLVVMMFLSSRSKKKAEKQRTELLSSLKRGDRVQTIGGILGTVVEASAEKVLLKVDETSNTKISFARSAVHRVVSSDGKAE